MALFARTRNHAREVELEQRVNALQVALNQCKGVARQWWGLRARFAVGVAGGPLKHERTGRLPCALVGARTNGGRSP